MAVLVNAVDHLVMLDHEVVGTISIGGRDKPAAAQPESHWRAETKQPRDCATGAASQGDVSYCRVAADVQSLSPASEESTRPNEADPACFLDAPAAFSLRVPCGTTK